MKADFQIEGLKELERKLLLIEDRTLSRKVMRRAFMAALSPIWKDARRRAPAQTGDFRKSIRRAVILNKRILTGGIRMFMGRGKPGWRWAIHEFGTYGSRITPPSLHPKSKARKARRLKRRGGTDAEGARPTPFLRPAWDQNVNKAGDIFRDTLREEIDKVARSGK